MATLDFIVDSARSVRDFVVDNWKALAILSALGIVIWKGPDMVSSAVSSAREAGGRKIQQVRTAFTSRFENPDDTYPAFFYETMLYGGRGTFELNTRGVTRFEWVDPKNNAVWVGINYDGQKGLEEAYKVIQGVRKNVHGQDRDMAEHLYRALRQRAEREKFREGAIPHYPDPDPN